MPFDKRFILHKSFFQMTLVKCCLKKNPVIFIFFRKNQPPQAGVPLLDSKTIMCKI